MMSSENRLQLAGIMLQQARCNVAQSVHYGPEDAKRAPGGRALVI
jgi:hypothetical protein